MNHDIQPTSGRSWRDRVRRGVVVALPSGNYALIRSISVETLIAANRVPDSLTSAVVDVWESINVDERMTYSQIENYVNWIVMVCKEAFISPRIVDNPTEDDEISIDDLSSEDMNFVAGLINKPVSYLEKFRPEQENGVGGVDSGAVNRKKPKRVPAPG